MFENPKLRQFTHGHTTTPRSAGPVSANRQFRPHALCAPATTAFAAGHARLDGVCPVFFFLEFFLASFSTG